MDVKHRHAAGPTASAERKKAVAFVDRLSVEETDATALVCLQELDGDTERIALTIAHAIEDDDDLVDLCDRVLELRGLE